MFAVSSNSLVDHSGKCPNCSREYHSKHLDVVVCGCYEICPLCGQGMQDYVPDLAPNTYGLDGKRDLQVLKVCSNLVGHSDHSPYYSVLKPVEVDLA